MEKCDKCGAVLTEEEKAWYINEEHYCFKCWPSEERMKWLSENDVDV